MDFDSFDSTTVTVFIAILIRITSHQALPAFNSDIFSMKLTIRIAASYAHITSFANPISCILTLGPSPKVVSSNSLPA